MKTNIYNGIENLTKKEVITARSTEKKQVRARLADFAASLESAFKQLTATYLDDHGSFPENLHIIFSEWRDLDVPNPHNLPTSRPVWKGEKVEGIMCPGSCSECAAFDKGCWSLKKGERILFEAH